MNRDAFYAALRSRAVPIFGTSLSQGQVDGINALLDSCARNAIADGHHVANILAQVFRETGGRMAPVRETFAASDAQAIARLEAAWKAGKLTWVKTPYWRDGWFGRGQIQLTHKDNYAELGAAIGVDLVANPGLALVAAYSADIAVIGMSKGLFTGKKLSDYAFPAALDEPPKMNPRRIVNGPDGSDMDVAGYHRAFFTAIEAGGGWKLSEKPADARKPVPPSVPLPTPETAPPASAGWIAAILHFVLNLFTRK